MASRSTPSASPSGPAPGHQPDSGATPALAWESSAHGVLRLAPSWAAFTGGDPDAPAGARSEHVHPEDRAACAERIAKAHVEREAFSQQYRIRRHDGEYRWLFDSAVPRLDADGRFAGFAGAAMDVTDLKRSEEQLRARDRHKDDFLATLAHELRNPLAAIFSSVQLLQLGKLPDSELRLGHDVIERQTRILTRLVEDLLDVSRIGRGQLQLRREAVDLATVLRNAADASRPLLDQSGHRLEVLTPATPVVLHADPVRLAQVVCNLLTNAAIYTPPEGRIELSAGLQEREVRIQVRDSGIGIPPEMLATLFDPPAAGGRRSPTGLGIGLTLARQLVEMHGGTIEASSGGLGTGTGFLVRLPHAAPPPGAAAAEAAAAPARSPHQRRVLIVDDNRDATRILSLLLGTMGHEVRTVYDGERALDEASAFRPNVVLLDIGLPGMDGYEAAKRLRAMPGGEELLLIALTGWGHDEARRKSKEAGFDHHVVKPVDSKTLRWLLAGPER